MKQITNRIKPLLLCVLLLLTIFDSKTTLTSVLRAMELCLKTVVPGIFPILFLTSALATEIQSLSMPMLERALHIPTSTTGYFLIGLLCGYPVGGKLLQDAINSKAIREEDGIRMIVFCNNASPAFIIGVLTPLFSSCWISVAMWCIQIISSFILGAVLPASHNQLNCQKIESRKNIGHIMTESLKAIASICGWVVIFAIIIAYLEHYLYPGMHKIPKVLISGSMELTNGIFCLRNIDSISISFVISSILLSFGGICIILQTKSVAPDLKICDYIKGRLLHAGISGILASLLSIVIFQNHSATTKTIPLFLCATAIGILTLRLNKKVVAFKEIM